MRPVDGITLDEAAHICGCSRRTLVRHIDAGRLPAGPKHERRRVSRADAEALALQLPSSRLPFDPDTSYWVTAKGAAAILGVNASRLNQLVAAGRVPFEIHADGRRMYRREQMLTVANARDARWH
jgi:excisionase family DNA binding protein